MAAAAAAATAAAAFAIAFDADCCRVLTPGRDESVLGTLMVGSNTLRFPESLDWCAGWLGSDILYHMP